LPNNKPISIARGQGGTVLESQGAEGQGSKKEIQAKQGGETRAKKKKPDIPPSSIAQREGRSERKTKRGPMQGGVHASTP